MSQGMSTATKVVLGIGALCVFCCGGPMAIWGVQELTMTPEEKEARAAAKAAEELRGDEVAAGMLKLASLQGQFNPLEWSDNQACEASAIDAARGDSGQERLLLTDFEQLQELASGEDKSDYWDFRRDGMPTGWRDGAYHGSSSSLADKALLGIYVDLERFEPETFDGDSFEGGYYDGYVVVVDARTQQKLCWARMIVENSEVVEFEEGFSETYSMKRAIDKDFQNNFKSSLERLELSPVQAKIGFF